MSPTIKACLWMLGTVSSFILMAVCGRVLAGDLDTFEIMMYRSFVGIVVVVGVIQMQNRWSEVTTDRLGMHFFRNIGHFTGQNLWFAALPLIPLAQVFALEFTTPLWVLLLAPLVLGERLTRVGMLAAVLGFIGILVVTRPGMIAVSPGVIFASLSAIGFALSVLLTRKLTQTATTACILFYLTTMQAVMGVVMAGYDMDIALPSLANLPWVVLVGLAGLFAHFCYTSALQLAPATVVAPVDFIRLPLVMVVGALLYGEVLDPFVALGAVLIFGGNYLNILSAARRAQSSR
ncbi:MAG: DMT family transporter [Marinovum sp.]|nr:DMT family transporter [Marinovum sp.]